MARGQAGVPEEDPYCYWRGVDSQPDAQHPVREFEEAYPAIASYVRPKQSRRDQFLREYQAPAARCPHQLARPAKQSEEEPAAQGGVSCRLVFSASVRGDDSGDVVAGEEP